MKALSQLQRGRVLVIDEEVGLSAVLRWLLAYDADVVAESSALDALARLGRGERFDLILCDVRLRGVLGPDFLATARRYVPAAARTVVLMTGEELPAGVDATCLRKPLDLDDLRALLKARIAARDAN